ncbi:MAG TPA: hypothetical protein VED20_03710, partial [Streptosporangiaceae bacterium]|nr:hypothetical protein [Streptosporangiaceae bacterium]
SAHINGVPDRNAAAVAAHNLVSGGRRPKGAHADCADVEDHPTLGQQDIPVIRRHNLQVGTIGVEPTSAQRRI